MTATPASPVHGQPFMVAVTVSNPGSVDGQMQAVEINGDPNTDVLFGAPPVLGKQMAGTNLPANNNNPTIANGGGSAVYTFWAICPTARSGLRIGSAVYIKNTGTGYPILILPTDLSLTVT
jgi:hypothetical protein